VSRPKSSKPPRLYTPGKTKAWEADAAERFRQIWDGADPHPGPLVVKIDAVKSRRRTDRQPGRFLRVVKPDVDNVVKIVLDALEKAGVCAGDQVVASIHATSWHTAPGERACVEVRVFELVG